MSNWQKFGETRPRAGVQKPSEKERRFKIRKGEPGETWIVSFCDRHGFTDASLLRINPDRTSLFAGECGCEILHGDFCIVRDNGEVEVVNRR